MLKITLLTAMLLTVGIANADKTFCSSGDLDCEMFNEFDYFCKEKMKEPPVMRPFIEIIAKEIPAMDSDTTFLYFYVTCMGEAYKKLSRTMAGENNGTTGFLE